MAVENVLFWLAMSSSRRVYGERFHGLFKLRHGKPLCASTDYRDRAELQLSIGPLQIVFVASFTMFPVYSQL